MQEAAVATRIEEIATSMSLQLCLTDRARIEKEYETALSAVRWLSGLDLTERGPAREPVEALFLTDRRG